jgi:hypothetical protein
LILDQINQFDYITNHTINEWLVDLKLVKSKLISEDMHTSLPMFNLCTRNCTKHEHDSFDCPHMPRIKLPCALILAHIWSEETKVSMYSAILKTKQNHYKKVLDDIHSHIEKLLIAENQKELDHCWRSYFINYLGELMFGINLQYKGQVCKNSGTTIPNKTNAFIEISMQLERPHNCGRHVLRLYFQDAYF